MRFGLQLAPLQGETLTESCRFMIEIARVASEYGYEVLVAPQHYSALPYRYPHATTLLARIAGETGAALATGVLPLPLLRPVEVAEAMATLEALTAAPCILGVGLGYRPEEYEAFGVPFSRRGDRLQESLAAVKRIRLGMDTASRRTGPAGLPWGMSESWNGMPVWVGASATQGITRAARLGATWFAGPTASHEDIARGMDAFHAAGGSSHPQTGSVLPIRRDLLVTFGGTALRESAMAMVRRRYETYADWGLFADGATTRPSEAPGSAGNGPVVGTVDECADALRSLQDAIPVEALVILRLTWPGMEPEQILTQLRLVGQELAPRLMKETR